MDVWLLLGAVFRQKETKRPFQGLAFPGIFFGRLSPGNSRFGRCWHFNPSGGDGLRAPGPPPPDKVRPPVGDPASGKTIADFSLMMFLFVPAISHGPRPKGFLVAGPSGGGPVGGGGYLAGTRSRRYYRKSVLEMMVVKTTGLCSERAIGKWCRPAGNPLTVADGTVGRNERFALLGGIPQTRKSLFHRKPGGPKKIRLSFLLAGNTFRRIMVEAEIVFRGCFSHGRILLAGALFFSCKGGNGDGG